ncbi:hypothetical protein NAC44_20440 [Allorhizobium sp. BGMRC 0089]|uniref:hypothetical protein n=1 Tax=Allorhizobium sonneratiae TaxID=2934936 RepID=UPI0020349454|nr:hypothetical protein [Allorhizobium sonneratiae]MCM2294700.1 hypothetical protein [Allorhizobium sonneratiae]
MKKLLRYLIASALMASSSAPNVARADDASWGCQVLLCSAASAPDWHGIPYCLAPMHKLIAAMVGFNFSWPICTEAGTGKPGYEEYADCPTGWVIGYANDNSKNSQGVKPSLCIIPRTGCTSNLYQREGDRRHGVSLDCEHPLQQMERAKRDDPYYYDISDNNGVKQRFYFNLNY